MMKGPSLRIVLGPAAALLAWAACSAAGLTEGMVRVLAAAAWMLVWWVAEGGEHAKKTRPSSRGSTYLCVLEHVEYAGMKKVHRPSSVVGISLTNHDILLDCQLPPRIHFANESRASTTARFIAFVRGLRQEGVKFRSVQGFPVSGNPCSEWGSEILRNVGFLDVRQVFRFAQAEEAKGQCTKDHARKQRVSGSVA